MTVRREAHKLERFMDTIQVNLMRLRTGYRTSSTFCQPPCPKRRATALVTPSAAPPRAAENQQMRAVRVGNDARRRDGSPVHGGHNVAHGATTAPVLSLCHSEMATQPSHFPPPLHPTHHPPLPYPPLRPTHLPPLPYPIIPPFTSTHAPHHNKVPLAMPGQGQVDEEQERQ